MVLGPWCTICRAEAPDVTTVAAEYEGRVRVVIAAAIALQAAVTRWVIALGPAGFLAVAAGLAVMRAT